MIDYFSKLTLTEKISDILLTLLYLSFFIFESRSGGIYIMISLTIVLFAINLINSKKVNFKIGIYHIYFILLVVFAYCSVFWAQDADLAIVKANTLFQLFILFSILYAVSYNSSIERLLNVVMWGGFLLAIYSVLFYGVDNLSSTFNDNTRLDSDFANINLIGMTCCMSIVIAVYFIRIKPSLITILFTLPSLVIVAGSGSRKALMMLLIGISLVLFFNRTIKHNQSTKRPLRSFFILSILLILFIVIIFKSGIFDGSFERLEGLVASFTGEGEVDHSSELRSYFREIGFNQLSETPFLGLGMDNARLLAADKTGIETYLHNNYAELAANVGIIGLVLYYWIYFLIIADEWKERKINTLASIILTLVIITLIMDYGLVSYYSKSTYFLLMIYMLHINKLKKENKSSENEKNILPAT